MTILVDYEGCHFCGRIKQTGGGLPLFPKHPDFCSAACYNASQVTVNNGASASPPDLVLENGSLIEIKIQQNLRNAVLDCISFREMSNQQIADLLGLLPSGVAVLLAQQSWSLETCFRFAEALGMVIDVTWSWEE